MSTVASSQQTTLFPPLASPAVYRMTVAEYERIAERLDDPRLELVDGYLVRRTDVNAPHVLVTERLRRRLDRMVPPGWFVREEKPVRIPDFNEPFPDISIARGDPEAYRSQHPGPADLALLIEVAETTLGRDRGEKWLAYAQNGISVYWIVNLVDRRIEVYTGPGPAGYANRQDFAAGQQVPVVIDGQQVGQIAVDDILP